MRHHQLNGAVLSPYWKDKLRKFTVRFTENPESKIDLYSGMGVIYTLLAFGWFLVDAIWGIAWTLLAVVAWLLTYLNWRKSIGVRRAPRSQIRCLS